MVKIGTVWDRTTDVLRGRGAILGSIAAIAIFLPAVVNGTAALTLPGGTPTTALVMMVIALGVLAANVWGQMAMVALASDPATTRAEAMRRARERVLPMIGVLLLLGVILALGLVPIVLMLVRQGINLGQQSQIAGAAAKMPGGFSLYILILSVVLLVVAARLLLLNAVVLHERRGVGALARSWRLTRGLTFRLIALLLLFGTVMLVPTLAAQWVVGGVARLLLGEAGAAGALLLATIAGAAVQTVFTVIATAFTGQFYVATVRATDGDVAA